MSIESFILPYPDFPEHLNPMLIAAAVVFVIGLCFFVSLEYDGPKWVRSTTLSLGAVVFSLIVLSLITFTQYEDRTEAWTSEVAKWALTEHNVTAGIAEMKNGDKGDFEKCFTTDSECRYGEVLVKNSDGVSSVKSAILLYDDGKIELFEVDKARVMKKFADG